jgi:hypothetical protein
VKRRPTTAPLCGDDEHARRTSSYGNFVRGTKGATIGRWRSPGPVVTLIGYCGACDARLTVTIDVTGAVMGDNEC